MSKLQLRIFDGTRKLFVPANEFLVTVTDGEQTQRYRNYYDGNEINFDVPFFNNFGDNYTVVVWKDGFKQAGFTPVVLSDQFVRTVDIMLVPNTPRFNFDMAQWDAVFARFPFLGGDVDGAAA